MGFAPPTHQPAPHSPPRGCFASAAPVASATLNALIEHRAETDNQLCNHCVMPRKATYVSHRIQNELIELCGNEIVALIDIYCEEHSRVFPQPSCDQPRFPYHACILSSSGAMLQCFRQIEDIHEVYNDRRHTHRTCSKAYPQGCSNRHQQRIDKILFLWPQENCRSFRLVESKKCH